ncbi:MAG TPA: hypothetical protein VG820_01350 [Fimbriimonadaceae bacterium]|nr:hypothetical protein [Fimbriimonadaceae bacterium]
MSPILLEPAFRVAEYRIVDIREESVFAGKLGRRVHEKLTVEAGGKRYVIDVRGDFHTNLIRPSQRLRVGDMVRIALPLGDRETSIARTAIARVKV